MRAEIGGLSEGRWAQPWGRQSPGLKLTPTKDWKEDRGVPGSVWSSLRWSQGWASLMPKVSLSLFALFVNLVAWICFSVVTKETCMVN